MLYIMGDPCTVTRLVRNGRRMKEKGRGANRGYYFKPAIVTVKFDDGSTLDTDIINLRADGGITEIHAAIKAVDEGYQEIPE